MKKLLIFTFLIFTFSCSTNEVEESIVNTDKCKTFLECFDGRYFPVNDVMIKFSNNPNSIWIEVWDFSNECLLSYNNNETILDVASNENIDYAFNLISNDSDFIVIRSAVETYDDGYEYYEEIIKASITADGNLLWEYYDDLTLTGTSESYVYNMLEDSTVNEVLNLEDCNNEANQVSSNNNSINEVENSSLSILNDVGDVKPGPDGVPGTIQIDNCDWKPVFSDNRGNIAAAYNEDNNTLLITHADYFFSPGYNSGADNRTFFENILGTNKKGLFSIGINFETELIDPFLDHMISLGNSGRNFISDSSIEQTIADLEVGFNQLSDYDYLIYNPEDNRLSTSEISLLRDYIDDPNKSTILVGLGWVWASYHRENQAELMPLNILLEPYGVQFVTDGNTPDHYTYDIHNETIYYPDTYITKTDYFDCSLGD